MAIDVKNTKPAQRLMRRNRNLTKQTRLDRIRGHYFEGLELSLQDAEYRELLESANAKLCGGESKEGAAKLLQEEFNVSKSTSYKALRESLQLFGDVTKANKDGLKHVITEQYFELIRLAKEKGNYDVWRRCLDSVVSLNGLHLPEEKQKTKRRRRILLNYSSDVIALEETEEIE